MGAYIYLRMLRSKREGNVLAWFVSVSVSLAPPFFSLAAPPEGTRLALPASCRASFALAINNNPGRADSFFFRHSRVNVSAYVHGETFALRSFSRSAPT